MANQTARAASCTRTSISRFLAVAVGIAIAGWVAPGVRGAIATSDLYMLNMHVPNLPPGVGIQRGTNADSHVMIGAGEPGDIGYFPNWPGTVPFFGPNPFDENGVYSFRVINTNTSAWAPPGTYSQYESKGTAFINFWNFGPAAAVPVCWDAAYLLTADGTYSAAAINATWAQMGGPEGMLFSAAIVNDATLAGGPEGSFAVFLPGAAGGIPSYTELRIEAECRTIAIIPAPWSVAVMGAIAWYRRRRPEVR